MGRKLQIDYTKMPPPNARNTDIEGGKALWHMGETKLREAAKEAGALFKMYGSTLINIQVMNDYIDRQRIEQNKGNL